MGSKSDLLNIGRKGQKKNRIIAVIWSKQCLKNSKSLSTVQCIHTKPYPRPLFTRSCERSLQGRFRNSPKVLKHALYGWGSFFISSPFIFPFPSSDFLRSSQIVYIRHEYFFFCFENMTDHSVLLTWILRRNEVHSATIFCFCWPRFISAFFSLRNATTFRTTIR